jgi:hypothetical protein
MCCGAVWFDLYVEWCIMEIRGRNVDKSGEKIKLMWITYLLIEPFKNEFLRIDRE